MRLLLLLCSSAWRAAALVPLGCFSSLSRPGVVHLKSAESSVHFVGEVCLQSSQYFDVWVSRRASQANGYVNVSIRTPSDKCCAQLSIARIETGYPASTYHPCSPEQPEISRVTRQSSFGLIDAYYRAIKNAPEPTEQSHTVGSTKSYAEHKRSVRFSGRSRWQGFRLAVEAQTSDPAATLQYEIQIGTPLTTEPLPLPLASPLQSLENRSRAMVRRHREEQLMAPITDFPDDGTLHTTEPAFFTRGATLAIMATLFVLVALFPKLHELGAALTCSDAPEKLWWFNQLPKRRLLRPFKLAGGLGLIVFGVFMLSELLATIGFEFSFLPAWTAALFETQLALFVGLSFVQSFVIGLIRRVRKKVLAQPHELPLSEVENLSGPQLAAYLRFQAEMQTKPSLPRRVSGVVLAVGSSAVGATVAAALLTLDALDIALGLTSFGGTLVGWIPGLGTPTRVVSLAHHTVGFAQTLRGWLANPRLWKNIFFLGAPAVRDALYFEEPVSPALGLQGSTIARLQALAAVVLWATVHVLATWHWMPNPDSGGSAVRWIVESIVLVSFMITLPLWVAYGVSRVVEYPITSRRVAVEGSRSQTKK